MTWSIRARLTAGYGAVLVIGLLTGAVAVILVQRRHGLDRLDGELNRLLLTLEGVMRTEINEGLTLQASADEASMEVVAPDRTLVLVRPDGALLAMWGSPFTREWRPDLARATVQTITKDAQRFRAVTRPIAYKGHQYVVGAIATLADLDAEQAETVRPLVIGLVVALLVAATGGWIAGRRALRPLTALATQAAAITEKNPAARLSTPHTDDELGRFASGFNGLLDRLSSVLHSQRQFMADASHELRTPVSVVRTTAQVTLARDGRQEAEYRDSLTIVAEQAERLGRLVDSMFLLSRADAEGVPVRPEPLYLDELVGDCARAFRVLAAERGVSITTAGSTDNTFVGDDTLLRQMVGNLLDNAVRHARPQGRISATIEATTEEVSIVVADDGDGVPLDQREQIFQRFVRLDSRATGAGLGLPIARWIAEAHGGRLVLEDSPVGASFRVVLPLT